MDNNIKWIIPESIVNGLKSIPKERPVALLIRHSVRPAETDFMVEITEEGKEIAREFGEFLGNRLGAVFSSPFTRCLQTAEEIIHGSGMNREINKSKYLGDPGVFIVNNKIAGKNWSQDNLHSTVKSLISSNSALPGMSRPRESAQFLASYILNKSESETTTGNINLFITHDSIIATVISQLAGRKYDIDEWPWFLEGAICSGPHCLDSHYRTVGDGFISFHAAFTFFSAKYSASGVFPSSA